MEGSSHAGRFVAHGLVLLIAAVALCLAGAQPKLYVPHQVANAVSVIDTATQTLAGSVNVDAPGRIAVTRDGARAFVTSAASNSIAVIDTSSDVVVSTIAVGGSPSFLAVTPD